jgi:hypothetical protein
MIPREIESEQCLFQATICEWRLEVSSTNWSGYWIVQLAHRKEKPLALLIDLDNLAAICQGLRKCIDVMSTPDLYPRATMMLDTCARELHTPDGSGGAIMVVSEWESTPIVSLRYYRGGHGAGNVIEQSLYVDDAMRLYDMFAQVYDAFPNKQAWTPKSWCGL